MRQTLTDVTVVLDRSGSMADILADAQGGLDRFIEDQKKAPGDCVLTLVEFDNSYDVPIRAVPVKSVGRHEIVPRGATALLGAVGRAVDETGRRLAALPEADRPGLVVVVILTDGEENNSPSNEWSRPYTPERVRQMIEHQQAAYKWQFTFLAADQDGWKVASAMGIQGASSGYARSHVGAAFAAGSANVGRMRTAAATGTPVANAYTEDELKQMAATTPASP